MHHGFVVPVSGECHRFEALSKFDQILKMVREISQQKNTPQKIYPTPWADASSKSFSIKVFCKNRPLYDVFGLKLVDLIKFPSSILPLKGRIEEGNLTRSLLYSPLSFLPRNVTCTNVDKGDRQLERDLHLKRIHRRLPVHLLKFPRLLCNVAFV